MCQEHLEARDELSQRNTLVTLPLLVRVHIVHKDNEIVVSSLVVNLGLDAFSSSHLGGSGFVKWDRGVVVNLGVA